ncbi:MAG TPA: bifunctional phosphoglucose/phosphomannose isomerase [Anaerolineales bacterium]|nr:bifunctional phosphoglucose/phosphomannose isomerase [Anaerolineales bacterium]
MFLDDPFLYKHHDPSGMLAEIERLPDQLEEAWRLGKDQPLPEVIEIDRVVIAGMGGSAIGADLLGGLIGPVCPVPLLTHRDYGLPGWAAGHRTLVIASSHSGNTEETLSAFDEAVRRGCTVLSVSTGGKLKRRAEEAGAPHWSFEHTGQPRAGVGYSFGLLLAALTRLRLAGDPSADLAEAVEQMKVQVENLGSGIPAVQNPGKRYGGQLMDRSFVVFGAEFLAPVARRWKTQVNEHAKAWAHFEELPEADHNTLEGVKMPVGAATGAFAMFLLAPGYSERIARRMDLTRQAYMLEGVSTDFYMARGKSRMAQMWTAVQFGDYVAYYLAIAYGVDPTPVETLESFKRELQK